MFQWDKSLQSLNVPADQVVQLFRSMRDVQMALPGLPAQESSAYLCQYQVGNKVGTLAAFHMHKSGQLALYVDDPREVPADKAERSLDQAMVFVESMGFLMNDLDIQLLSVSERTLLWESIPLQKGATSAAQAPPAKPAPAKLAAPVLGLNKPAPKVKTDDPFKMASPPAGPSIPVAAPPQPAVSASPAADAAEVDDLLAAVEALRASRPGMRPRKKAPSPEELLRRRQDLFTNVGRILASL